MRFLFLTQTIFYPAISLKSLSLWNCTTVGAASFLMIHNCWVVTAGNRHDMIETAAFLEPFDTAMVDVYTARSKGDPKTIAKWMDAETYMSGSTAVERGFAEGNTSTPGDFVVERAFVEQ